MKWPTGQTLKILLRNKWQDNKMNGMKRMGGSIPLDIIDLSAKLIINLKRS